MRQTLLLTLTLFVCATALPDWSQLISADDDDDEPSNLNFGSFFDVPLASSAPTGSPTLAPTSAPSSSPTQTITRNAQYRYQWGGLSTACDYSPPATILKCLGGGLLSIDDTDNADCEVLAADTVLCSRVDESDDGLVDLRCVGVTPTQLTASARTLPSEAANCDEFDGEEYSGFAVSAASLARYCRDSETNEMELDSSWACSEGMGGVFEGERFCSSSASCTDLDCSIYVAPVSTVAYTEDERCSSPDLDYDLVGVSLTSSTLASVHLVDWTYSESPEDCEGSIPDITIACQEEGTPSLYNGPDYCTSSGDKTITCSAPGVDDSTGIFSVHLEVWCYGRYVEQLSVTVDTVDSDDDSSTCQPTGHVDQKLSVTRGCGKAETEYFELLSSPEFCVDSTQSTGNGCYTEYSCPDDGTTCTDVELSPVSVDTTLTSMVGCVYADY